MKRRFSYTLAASTLVEMLIVIIVSGILFIALFDGVNLVRRYTNRLNKTLAAGNSLLVVTSNWITFFYHAIA